MSLVSFTFSFNHSAQNYSHFNTQGLFNKQVCLTLTSFALPAFGLSGRYWLKPVGLLGRTSCLLCHQLKASLMAMLATSLGLQT